MIFFFTLLSKILNFFTDKSSISVKNFLVYEEEIFSEKSTVKQKEISPITLPSLNNKRCD